MSPNFASPPSLHTSQIFLTGRRGRTRARRASLAVRGPQKRGDGGGPAGGWNPGPSSSHPRTASARNNRHRPHPTRLHNVGRGFWQRRRGFRQRRRAFRSSIAPACFLSGVGLPIIDRRWAAYLVGGSHRRVSLADQALYSSKGHHGGRCSSFSFLLLFSPRGLCFRSECPGLLAVPPT